MYYNYDDYYYDYYYCKHYIYVNMFNNRDSLVTCVFLKTIFVIHLQNIYVCIIYGIYRQGNKQQEAKTKQKNKKKVQMK